MMIDQAKMLMQVKKLQKELGKTIIEVEAGDGAVVVQINGEQKIKKINLDKDKIDFDDLGELETYIEEAVKQAIVESQQLAAEKMKPMMGQLGNLGL
ncbi:YbaB/EbfC family nucleoid-associated protein [Candidatus Saccharibacteria bacterium]|nr:YbaB/EbfC family nucleoid-associated protein [Candidatus Saccharibacteria bacterium]